MIRFSAAFLLALIPVAGVAAWFTFRRYRKRLILRTVTIILLILALAGLSVAVRRPENNVMFLIDRSASVAQTESMTQIYSKVQEIVNQHPDWSYGVIGFAEHAFVHASLGTPALAPLTEPVPDAATNVTEAVELALSVLPDAGANQLVLVTDGRFSDSADSAIGAAQLAGIPVSVIPVGSPVEADVSVADFQAPTEVEVGRPFSLGVQIAAREAGDATLALYRNDDLLLVHDMALQPGLNSVSLVDALSQLDTYRYRIAVKSPGDPIPENDGLSLLVRTTTRPAVLLVDRSATSFIPDLLNAIGVSYVQTDVVPPLEALSDYRQLVLAGFALDVLTAQEASHIDHFVRNLGGGLLVVRGEDDVRGFASTKLDDLLPVSSSVPQTGQAPSLAIVYLLDRSSSMRALTNLVAKIRLLRNAAAASITLLPADALVGVVAFSDEFEWTIPLAPVGEGTAVYGALRSLRAEGGTDMYYALVDAFDRLVEVEARSKHLVLITDGKTTNNPRDYPGFLERLESQQDVTLTSIALGESPNFALLGTLVESGRGALYHVTDYLKLPQLTMQVTQRLSRSRFVAGDVDVVGTLAESSEIAIPPITGYVLTYPRTTARTLLWAGEDPLFATWRVGVGASSVLNTDLDGNWSQNWVSWAQASVLFEEMLAATEPLVASAAGLLPSIVIEPAETQLLVDARDESGAFGDFLKLEAAILPTENVFEVPQVAPGLYRVRFSTPAEGGYAVQLHDRTRGRTAIFSFTVPYPSEYRASGADRAMFETITRATGGAIVEGGTPLTSPSGAERIGHKPLFEILLLAALALFLIELILRKRPRRPRSLDSLRDAS